MAIELVRGARLFAGVPYAYAAIARQPDLIFTAGACPLDEDGSVVSPGDIVAQTRQAMRNLRITLQDCGVELRDVVKTTIYVVGSRREDLTVAWHEVVSEFADHRPPSTLLGVAMLGYPDQLVEIEAIAVASHT
ncbi:RidA family protein [Mycolicibacterium porcinum]|uniref:RidA family protein n=1 Tax=Mycolicibacterium porcinum TaxID=39693 RepID=A0ABV3VQV5_9MYCO